MATRLAALVVVLLIVGGACGQRPGAVLGTQVSGCREALAERSAATARIDLAAEQAVARNGARAAELRGVAEAAKRELGSAAALGGCEDPNATRGVAVDLADLRERYRVITERAAQRLDEAAAQPVPPARNDKKGKGGTKGGD